MKIGKANVGFDQIAVRTPMAARWFFRGVLYLAALINIVLATIVEIPEEYRLIIGKYSVYAVTLVHAISRLFGIEVAEVEQSNPPTYVRNKTQ